MSKKPRPYLYGRAVEYEAKRRLIEHGAKIVVRSSRSLTPVDLIAVFPDKKEIWLVQVKKAELEEQKYIAKKVEEQLSSLAGIYIALPYLFIKVKGRYTFLKLT